MKNGSRSRGVDAEITVFISLIMMCLFALFCVLVESARTAGARWYLQMAANSAMDSVFSQYHRQMWDSYRLLFAEYDSEEALTEDFSDFIQPYLETENWYPMKYEAAEVDEMLTVFDENGAYFEKEILDYMKYGVWNLDFDVDMAGELLTCGKEAEAVKKVAESYRGHAADALRLEKSLEAISENLTEQMEKKQEGLSRLHSYDNDGFQRKAEEMIRLLKKVPKLVKTYRKRADDLAEALKKSRDTCAVYRKDCSQEVDGQLEEEICQYEAYVSLDGERRQEIERLENLSEEQIRQIEEVMEDADEAERMMEEWEDDADEDGDEPDPEVLWRPVIRKFDNIVIPSLSFAHGVKDKEKEGWLNQVAEMYRSGMIALLVPAGTVVSDRYVKQSDLPSQSGEMIKGKRGILPLAHLMVNEYCGEFFTCFTDVHTGDKAATFHDHHALQYEMEYLLSGKYRDEENLLESLHQLLALREGLNLIHILSDASKRAEARNLALAITGLAGVSPLVFVTAFFVMSVWALGEAIMDIRGLLAGRKVPLMKTSGDWTLSLEELLKMGSTKDAGTGGGEQGIGYLSWLKVLLFLDEIVVQEQRMMDVMQMNLCLEQKNFQMNRMVYEVKITGRFCGKHVFFSLPFVQELINSEDHTYMMQVETERVY
ncbi:MAG: DUF5702 domain-containing protein [Brotaphodocola sp.]